MSASTLPIPTGELDFLITDLTPPLASLPDGAAGHDHVYTYLPASARSTQTGSA